MRLASAAAVLLGLVVAASCATPAPQSPAPVGQSPPPGSRPGGAEASNMRLLGHADLQSRSAYQPTIIQQGSRWIAYVGHHGGEAPNPMTGRLEPNGTSIVDVTDPGAPQYLHHIPGEVGRAEGGGAQMARVCTIKGKSYLLRTRGNEAHELWDVSDPQRPELVRTVLGGLKATHKNWWECASGIAYLVSDGQPSGWRSNRMIKIFDLSDPAHPRFIRDFGLVGQEPGATGEPVPEGVHGPIAFRNRIYVAYGTSRNGVLQIVDRDKLLRGNPSASDPFGPTPANLRYPEIGRLDMPAVWGGHTAFPVLGVPVPDFTRNAQGKVRDFVVLVSEETQNECGNVRRLTFMVDVTTESRPFAVSTFMVPESSGDFCSRGGRFGPHSSNESFTSIYYGKLVFIAYFNAGVRAVDIRDPFRPREVVFFIPAVTARTDKRCVTINGIDRCKVAIQTNNVEVDDRGLIYLADRADTGLHIVELTGPARAIATLP